jgi:pantoate--beta-alanine ligase
MNDGCCASSRPQAMQELGLEWRRQGLRVGLVPTMGYWHEGHLSLMRWARERCDVLVASIFVNPTQFGPGEDLENYPSDIERDSALARECGVDASSPRTGTRCTFPVTAPGSMSRNDQNLCGRSRSGHFQGVATVVCKLFNLVQPTFAAFGEKDWQQLAVIRKMTRELDIPVRVEGRPIVREADGLAMSSRNVYLTPEERAVAPHIQKGLRLLEEMIRAGEDDCAVLRKAVTHYYAARIPHGQRSIIWNWSTPKASRPWSWSLPTSWPPWPCAWARPASSTTNTLQLREINAFTNFLQAKLHRATITGAEVDYEGSVAICPDLIRLPASISMSASTSTTWTTASASPPMSSQAEKGEICLNGAAAHKGSRGQRVIIASYVQLAPVTRYPASTHRGPGRTGQRHHLSPAEKSMKTLSDFPR